MVILLVAALCTGVATYLSAADVIVPALAWIAPVPILALAFRRGRLKRNPATSATAESGPEPDSTSVHSKAALAIAAFLAAAVGQLRWLVLYRGELPPIVLLPFLLLLGAAFAMVVWLTAWAVERRGALAGVLLFPLLWVSFEFLLAGWSPHGTAGSLAYSQVDFTLLIQLAAWTGLSGITFVVQLGAAGVAAVIGTRGAARRWPLWALPAGALIAVVALGAWRIQASTPDSWALVGLASIDNATQHFDATVREDALPVVTSYLEAARTLAGRQVEAIVLPEKMVGIAPAYEDEVSSLLAAASEHHPLLLVAGLNLVGRKQPRNVAALFSRGGKALEYDKRRLVPGLEAEYAQGEGPGLYKAPGGMTGIAICKDMDFAEVGREYSRAGVGLLLVPAWDFTRDGWLHSRMALMRGVEGGYSVARAAADGLLTGSDDRGRVLAERASDAAAQSMLLAKLPIGRGKTFYGENGDWFGWMCVMAASLVLALAAFREQ